MSEQPYDPYIPNNAAGHPAAGAGQSRTAQIQAVSEEAVELNFMRTFPRNYPETLAILYEHISTLGWISIPYAAITAIFDGNRVLIYTTINRIRTATTQTPTNIVKFLSFKVTIEGLLR